MEWGQPKRTNEKLNYLHIICFPRLEEEASILKKMSHPNIIGFRGFQRGKDGTMTLAVENGQRALYDIIEKNREALDEEGLDLEPLDPSDILKVIEAMARGLDYLHNKQSLLHGDLKSGNVLIIGDFDGEFKPNSLLVNEKYFFKST